MAKSDANEGPHGHTTADVIEEKVVDIAEQLGRIIGTARARVDNWKEERQGMVEQLTKVVSEAQALLADLGHQAQNTASQAVQIIRRRGRPPGSTGTVKRGPGRPAGPGTPGRPKGRKMTAEARKRISDAQKARWAAQKAGGKKK